MTKAKNLLRFLKEERKSKLEVDRLSNENIQVIKKYFTNSKSIFYLDIGAGRPISQSLTYHLYKKGYRGITIDPLMENGVLHKILRPKDTFMLKLVGQVPGTIPFYHLKHYSYSTTLESVASKLIADGTAKLVSQTFIEQITLLEIIKKIPKHGEIFLKIDTEGADLAILKSNDYKRFRPNLICVEKWRGSEQAILDFLSSQGYELFSETKQNLFFVSS